MITLNKTLAAATAALITLNGTVAFADAHSFDISEARNDMSADANGNGVVDDDELIRANMAEFDLDGNGTIDAAERSDADARMRGNSTDLMADSSGAAVPAAGMQVEFDTTAARNNMAFDMDGDGIVDDDELIRGNAAIFDLDGNGTVDAAERSGAEEALMAGGSVILVGPATPSGMAADFNIDVAAAYNDMSADANGNGIVDDEELIRANTAVFDTDGNGNLDAAEQGAAEAFLRSEQ